MLFRTLAFITEQIATTPTPHPSKRGSSRQELPRLLAETPTSTAVIQCKFYSHPVGYDAVQQAYAAKALYKATAAYVVTNATYTPQARKAARQLGVTLTNHAEIAVALA